MQVWSNPDLRPDAPWSDLWNHDFWGAPIESWQSHKSYRPLTIASFRISYWLTGQVRIISHHALMRHSPWMHLHTQGHAASRGLSLICPDLALCCTEQDFDKLEKGSGNPLPWHLVNVVVHGIVSLLAMHLFRALRAPKGVPFAGAALFATHPIHTDAVSSIVSRGEMLSVVASPTHRARHGLTARTACASTVLGAAESSSPRPDSHLNPSRQDLTVSFTRR